jgi:hypothetical protein
VTGGAWRLLLALAVVGCGETCPEGSDIRAACVEDDGIPNVGSCTDAQFAHAGRCVATNLYVDSALGSDDDDGTAARPFKTIRRALSAMVAGQTLHLRAGEYATAAGDTLDQQLPDGITLQGLPVGASAAVLRANARESLTALGSVTIRDVVLEDFVVPLAAGEGQQLLERVVVRNSRGALLVTGTAQLTCQHCTFDNAQLSNRDWMIFARGASVLQLNATDIIGGPGDCVRGHTLVAVTDHASAALDQVKLAGSASNLFGVDSRRALTIRRTTINSPCEGYAAVISGQWQGEPESSVLIENSNFRPGLWIANRFKSFRVRGSVFEGRPWGLAFAGERVYADVGRPPAGGDAGEPGGNVIRGEGQRAGLMVNGQHTQIDASGNTWIPNVQGADANGHYPAGTTFTNASAAGSGLNITFTNIGEALAQVHL